MSKPAVNGPSFLLASLLLLGFAAMPVPYIRDEPGDTFNALGSVNGKQLVKIAKDANYPTYKTSGKIRILTVSELGGPIGPLALGDALRSIWDKSVQLVPTEFVFPANATSDSVQSEGEQQFVDSQSSAIAAALTEANIPLKTELRIVQVMKDSAAEGHLKVGDTLVAFDGHAVPDLETLSPLLDNLKAGQTVKLGLVRNGKQIVLPFKLGKHADGTPQIGVLLQLMYLGPMSIDIQLDNVGGPSAGLAMSLAIYDKLTPGNLTQGRVIAVTGTIDADGTVGAIGGVPQKMAAATRAGARTMFLPADNCVDTKDSVPAGLRVVPVKTLHQALDLLKAGKSASLPSCAGN